MKLLQITALALYLNVSLLHANGEDDQPWGRFGKQSVIGMSCALITSGTTMTVFGVKKIYSAVSQPINNSDTHIESNASASANQRTLKNNVFNGLGVITVGTAIAMAGYVTIINGLAAEVLSLKDN